MYKANQNWHKVYLGPSWDSILSNSGIKYMYIVIIGMIKMYMCPSCHNIEHIARFASLTWPSVTV